MRAMVDKGQDIESIAAHFLVTPAVVSQRLKLAKVSPRLHEVYAEDGMTLEQLMAFSVRSEEHTSELQSLMRISYAVFCLKKKNIVTRTPHPTRPDLSNTYHNPTDHSALLTS